MCYVNDVIICLVQTLTSVLRMEAHVTTTRNVLTTMDPTLVFVKMDSQEMEQFVLVNYTLKNICMTVVVRCWRNLICLLVGHSDVYVCKVCCFCLFVCSLLPSSLPFYLTSFPLSSPPPPPPLPSFLPSILLSVYIGTII